MSPLIFIPILISFILSAVFTPLLIPVLRKLKFGQQVRQEGNPEHLKKQGTPTMGGIAFLSAILLTSLLFVKRFPVFLPVLLLTLGFGIVGFIDDYLKVVKKQSEGFKAWQKLICQFVMTGVFAWYCAKYVGTAVLIPFTGGRTWNMGWLYIPFVFAAVLGTDNGVNFTDGVDGLCTSVTVVVAMFLLAAGLRIGNFSEGLASEQGISVFSGIVAGALCGFLLSNSHPAKVFMGDTGSLALGGFVAASAIVLRLGWFILIFGAIYLAEVISVVLQVGYFKLTHGKRIFKMAPIHHHFELSGYSETQVVALFTVVTFLAAVLAWIAM